jgi:tellurite resistance protein TerC
MGEAALGTTFWLALAGGFAGFVFYQRGAGRGLEFVLAYALELALSVDNLFVFLIVFSTFAVPAAFQHRVLFWGMIGAVLGRALFILAGAALIHRFAWVLFIFGLFLLYAAIKVLRQTPVTVDPTRYLVLRILRRLVPVALDASGPEFFVRRDGKLYATPLLLVLVVVEAVDLTFAADSIPAVFGVTRDTFVVLTSNIFAVLGLRALFFLVSGLARKLRHLRYGIAFVLAFIGAKIILGPFLDVPIALSLGVVVLALAAAALASLGQGRAGSGEEGS